MEKMYREILQKIDESGDEGVALQDRMSLLRSVLQAAMYSAVELYFYLEEAPHENVSAGWLSVVRHPSDGTPGVVISELLPVLRKHLGSKFCEGWFEPRPGCDQPPLADSIQEWVSFRNHRPGHGVLDKQQRSQWNTHLRRLLPHAFLVLRDLMPVVDAESRLLVDCNGCGICSVLLPIVINDRPLVVRDIRYKRGSWRLRGQVLDFDLAAEMEQDVDPGCPVVLEGGEPSGKYRAHPVHVGESYRKVLANLPPRQAPVFTARHKQIEDLVAWIEDTESHIALVYGDGGIGKTTLVLEVLHRVLNEEIQLRCGTPEIVCFYSAKEQRWTESGVITIPNVSSALDDALRELGHVIHDYLPKSWYRSNIDQLIGRVEGELREVGVERNEILLVIDNTETMVKHHGEEEALSGALRKISRKVGRVILTSRRREKIEAAPIDVPPLEDGEAGDMLRALADEFGARPLAQAGASSLKRLSRRLGGKPLLLDVVARYIGRTGSGLDDAIDLVMTRSEGQLSEFLYQDAWHRMTPSQRHVFLVLMRAHVPVTSEVVGWACREVGIARSEWEEGFEETRFGQLTDYGEWYELEFAELARQYMEQMYAATQQCDQDEIDRMARCVSESLEEADRIRSEFVKDRVGDAFQTTAAKAAKVEAIRGNLDDACEWYKIALNEDPMNAKLMDRFAWFLLEKKKDIEAAEGMALEAIKHDPDSADANLTYALIQYRKGKLEGGDRAVDKAVKCGKPVGLGLLRKGIARFHAAQNVSEYTERDRVLREAFTFIHKAIREIREDSDPFYRKNMALAKQYDGKIRRQVWPRVPASIR